MKRTFLRLLAALCTFCILLVAMPITAFADATKNIPIATIATSQTPLDKVTDTEPVILEERTDMREENVKYFRCDDGTIVAAVYDKPVHYQNGERWEEIDNSLKTAALKNQLYYTNTANSFKVHIPNSLQKQTPVQVEKDGYTLEWTPIDLTNVSVAKTDVAVATVDKATVSTFEEDTTGSPAVVNDQKLRLEKKNSTVTYADVYDTVDLRYDLIGNSLKESIILDSVPTRMSFSFRMYGEGLTAQLQADNTVCFFAENDSKAVFTVAAPYMMDNNAAHSDAVTVTLTQQQGAWIYTLTPSREWLEDPARAYPVTLDPTVVPADGTSSLQDAEVYSYKPTTNYGSWATMYVGGISAGGGIAESRSYIKLSLPNIATYADLQVVSAQMTLTYFASQNTGANDLQINMYPIRSEWDESVTWNTRPTVNTSHINDCIIGKAGAGTCTFDITALASEWFSGARSNYGVALHASTLNAAKAVVFQTREAATTAARPVATFNLRECSGLEDYWTYTSMSVGRGATASVNNATGTLTVVVPDCGIGGNRMPVSISHVYNPSNPKVRPYGGKFRLNYQMSVTSSGLTEYPYYFTDADGTKHYFKSEDGELKDEDGLGLTLTVNTSSVDEKFVITAKDKSRMVFNDLGNLRFIRDTNNNQIQVVYTGTTVDGVHKIDKIIDGAGRVYQLAYDANDRLESITTPAGDRITYAYNAWNELNTVYYPDGNVVNTFYDNAKVKRVRGNGQTIVLDYVPYAPIRVTGMYYETTETDFIERYLFDYYVGATAVTDSMNNTVTYQFNSYLQTVGVFRCSDGSAQSYKMGKPGGTAGTENKMLAMSDPQRSVVNYMTSGSVSGSLQGFTTAGGGVSYDAGKGHFSKGSIKVSSATSFYEDPTTYARQEYAVPADGEYVVSVYANVQGNADDFDATLKLTALRAGGGEQGTILVSQGNTDSDEWVRMTCALPCNAGGTLRVELGARSAGTVWFDDVQLEALTDVANTYNLLENSDFHDGSKWGTDGLWNVVSDSTIPTDVEHAVQVTGSPTEQHLCSQTVSITDGKKGDVYSFGAWAKANSRYVSTPDQDDDTAQYGLIVIFALKGAGNSYTSVGSTGVSFNPYYSGWQFTSAEAIAPADYDAVIYCFVYAYNVNNARFALPYLYKDKYGQSYTYDKNGNVVSSADRTQAQSSYAYNDNQLSKLASPTGSEQLMTYDETTRNMEYIQTSDGQRYEYTYDQYGNAVSSHVYASPYATDVTADTPYYIRNAYSGNAFAAGAVAHDSVVTNKRWSPAADTQLYVLIETNETDVYAIRPYSADGANLRIDVEGGTANSGARMQLYTNNDWTNQRFKFSQNDNGTFTILTKMSDYAKCIDGQPGNLIDTEDDTPITQQPTVEGDAGQQWYLIPYNSDESQTPHYVSTVTYTEDGNYAVSATDTYGQVTAYTTDTRGNNTSVTVANGVKTTYGYDTYGIHNTSVTVSKDDTALATVNYGYSQDRLTSITAPSGTQYALTYDAFGRAVASYVGSAQTGRLLSQKTYTDTNLLDRVDYGNGTHINYAYDALGRQIKMWYNDLSYTAVETVYDAGGRVGLIKDLNGWFRQRYTYDLAGRLASVRKSLNPHYDLGRPAAYIQYTYENGTNRLTDITVNTMYHGVLTNFVYGRAHLGEMPDTVYKVRRGMYTDIYYTYDSLGRLIERDLSGFGWRTEYTYENNSTDPAQTGTRISSVSTDGQTTTYTYDAAGNIATETANGTTVSYTYDALNELTGVTGGGKTYAYTYDAGGNILTARVNNVTNTYTYGDSTWKDLLTAYNGQTITYDQIGNPLTYRDGMTFTWQRGRQLATISKTGLTVQYGYDSTGVRTAKTVNGSGGTDYVYVDGVLYAQRTDDDILAFTYDENGRPYMITRLSYADIGNDTGNHVDVTAGGTHYYIEYNMQGDVVGLIDFNGQRVAAYTYDPWGKLLSVKDGNGNAVGSTHIANVNPLRYRGYYYDTETGFYYLQSRYYDPTTGRFINADNVVSGVNGSAQGHNLFVYCFNNPINMSDPSGNWPQWVKNAVKWVAKEVIKPAVNALKDVLSEIDFTYSTGIGASASITGLGVQAQGGLSVDSKGNIAIQGTVGVGLSTTGGCSGTVYTSASNAPDISSLEGAGYQVGGAYGWNIGYVPVMAGLDCDFIPIPESEDAYSGVTLTTGFGSPGLEGHVDFTYTGTLPYTINIFEGAESVYHAIMEW